MGKGTLNKTLERPAEDLKAHKGISAGDRLKNLADVQELIKIQKLSESFAEKLNHTSRNKFIELARAAALSHKNQEQ